MACTRSAIRCRDAIRVGGEAYFSDCIFWPGDGSGRKSALGIRSCRRTSRGPLHLERPSPHENWSSRRLLLPIVIRTLPATEVEQLRQCKNRCPVGGGDLALEKDVFKQAFSYEHENHYL